MIKDYVKQIADAQTHQEIEKIICMAILDGVHDSSIREEVMRILNTDK